VNRDRRHGTRQPRCHHGRSDWSAARTWG
jgi:hypothetical protein